MTELSLGNQSVKIDKGELVGYQVDGYEVIHQKGSPGWRNADTEMFPIIGPTNEANFRVKTLKGEAIQDQHGLLRELSYTLESHTAYSAVYEKKYTKNTAVKNSKYPAKSSEELLGWPYSFKFQKHFLVTPEGLEISFVISGEDTMPFMLGYHPAFKLRTALPTIDTGEKVISLKQVKAVGNRALPVLNCERITLIEEKKVHLKTEGFGNFMLWTEVDNMVCIEPISFYPYAVTQEDLSSGFMKLSTDKKVFKVFISVES